MLKPIRFSALEPVRERVEPRGADAGRARDRMVALPSASHNLVHPPHTHAPQSPSHRSVDYVAAQTDQRYSPVRGRLTLSCSSTLVSHQSFERKSMTHKRNR